MPIDFPNSPTNGQTFTSGDKTWEFDGTSWVLVTSTASIGTGAIATVNIADNAITTAKIAAGAVVEADIATDAVTTNKIANNAVTAAKLATTAAIQPTIVDAKGDLIVGTGADTVARQGVGANGSVLVADSTEATGVKWATPTSTFTETVFTNVSGATKSGADVTVDGGQYGFISRVNSDNTNGSYLGFFKARGTAGSQTIVQDNDDIALMRFFAYDGSTMREGARIYVEIDGTPGAGDMPARLVFMTTPDGSSSPTEKMSINNAGLITGSGTSLGAWTAFTPTWTNLTIGNATQDWVYCQIGKLVFVRGRLTWGSTTSATGGATVASLPVGMKSAAFNGLGSAIFVDSGTQTYWGEVYPNSTTSVGFNTQIISGNYLVSSAVTSVTPFTWTTNDSIQCNFMYEAA